MKGALRAAAVGCTILVASLARGQTPEGAPAPEPEEPTPTPASQPAVDALWARYHEAFDLLARGDIAAARDKLQAIVDARTGHPAEQRAKEILSALSLAPVAEPPEVEDVRAPETPTKLARAELAFWQTIMGIAVGAELCLALECDSPTAFVGTIVLGSGTGLAISLYATKDGLTSGRRGVWNSASTWGYWNGIALAVIAEEESTGDGFDANELALIMLGGQATGYAVGALIATQLEPSGGQVALANTVGIWTGVLTLFAMFAFEIDDANAAYFKGAVVASDLGLLAGCFLARAFPMSRGRTLLIDAGGVLGMLAGFGTAVLIGGDEVETHVGFASALAGTTLGLAGAVFFTRDWDAPSMPARVTIMPLPGGGATVGLAFDLDL
jgi:hypothetical protein